MVLEKDNYYLNDEDVKSGPLHPNYTELNNQDDTNFMGAIAPIKISLCITICICPYYKLT